ncbi:3-dehydroquinate dehydratase [Brevundimonas sp. NIBR10]|uniref:type II 3-dehydroquinate dehydratase n=1 Tax=Brevundimonas sp. NIBR10 TaxID=3015997 RepID=UPI0022F19678|nr:type II 3-dehydroquinate dehydratase [Brevundimonas sp. NIBR10]WGM48652.1 3-dehydroquinate dehydratase [Brevundimonas sp. NIBR10]
MPQPAVIYVLNGPNLNLLGTREPDIYGHETLADVQTICEAAADDFAIVFRQSNHEGELVDWIQEARTEAAALVINPAAYGHTSVAMLDAVKALSIPVVECHLSNLFAREAFRHHSFITPAASGLIAGFGAGSYDLAVRAAVKLARERRVATDRSV